MDMGVDHLLCVVRLEDMSPTPATFLSLNGELASQRQGPDLHPF